MIVYSQTQLVAMLAAIVDTGGPLDAVVVRLFQNNIVPTPTSVIGDFTEATFDNYAASSAVVWGTPYLPDADTAVVYGGAKEFLCDDDTTPNTIYGYYLTTGTSPQVLRGAVRFDTPQVVSGPLDGITVLPRAELQNPA